MASTFTASQTGAIACAVAVSLRGLVGIGALMTPGYWRPSTPSTLLFFGIFVIIGWILALLIIMRIRPAYIVGIFLYVLTMISLSAAPLIPPWYAFKSPVMDFSQLVGFYLFPLAGIYFNYKSYKELK